VALRLERQAELAELVFGVLGGFEVFLHGVEGFVAEPGLDSAHVHSGTKPTGDGSVAEAVQVYEETAGRSVSRILFPMEHIGG